MSNGEKVAAFKSGRDSSPESDHAGPVSMDF